MRWRACIVALLCADAALAGTAADAPTPSNQALVFYNARLALREHRTEDVLRLWLLHNALEDRGEMGPFDPDFRSVVWAALGDLALCQDGVTRDEEGGAGLWPLALHNWIARSLSKGPPLSPSPPWDVFEVARQQRFISLHDVLSAEELRSVSFFRGQCLLPRAFLIQVNEPPWADLDDRLTAGLLMRWLLEQAKTTLVPDKVISTAVIDARIFDLDLALAELQARRARRRASDAAQRARSVGVSKPGAEDVRRKVAEWADDSKQAVFLRKSLTWAPSDWLSLSAERRLSLFAQARPLAKDPEARDRLALGILDALVDRKEGEEVEKWIGFFEAANAPERRAFITSGARGERLLGLTPEDGFRERAVIAMHRGVAFLEAGQLPKALRSFAFVLHHAGESRDAETVAALARRWLSYVLSRFETSDEVLATLQALVPRQELNGVLEDLLWRAAVRADRASFDRVASKVNHGGALDQRLLRLQLLAAGAPGKLATALRDDAAEEPHAVVRFVQQLIEELETEDGDVRLANVETLKLLRRVLEPISSPGPDGKKNAQARRAEELMARAQAILDGLDHLDTSEAGRARAMSLQHETFAGNIRLAPSDPLPWPFRVPEPEAPSAFVPLKLEPVEWRDARGALVFGWRITE
ncbi:MAG: hypothetical protein IRZ16_20945 [Myxococcaceae bacterium]|nr:hypothetical protein [Myxococcaceae bacterium]